MKSRRITKTSLLLLFGAWPAVSFGPSAPKHHDLLKNTLDANEIDTDKTQILKEAAQEAIFATSIGINDTMILQKYYKRGGQDTESADLSKYLAFRKTFLGNLMKTATAQNSITKEDEEVAVHEKSSDIDELVIIQEYGKWLNQHKRTTDESRYPQFRKNFIRQFEHDLKDGNFFTLNEFGDCTEGTYNKLKDTVYHFYGFFLIIPVAAEVQALKAENSARHESKEIKYVLEMAGVPPQEMERRRWESQMFTPAVRRDIYRILRNPDNLNVGMTSSKMSDHDSRFTTTLLTKKRPGGNLEEFSFADKHDLKHAGENHNICDDIEMLQAVTLIGSTTSRGIAITKAFQAYLSKTARSWGDHEASTLSVEFLVAFGNELTERLDINHRIRSHWLSKEETKILREEPFFGFVDIDAVRTFGTVSNEPRAVLSKYDVERRKRSKQPKEIVEVTVRTQFDAEEMKGREQDLLMFSSAVRRDIYAILRNPNNILFGASIPVEEKSSVFGAVLLAKKSSGGEWDTFAFADRHAFEKMKSSSKTNYIAFNEDEMVEAISHIGMINPVALAVTEAFEAYLSQLVKEWGDREVACLSIEFLVAFGRELSVRLDANNRLRSTELSKEEMLILATEPFASCVHAEVMRLFQSRTSTE
jgi:hypothetical protein